MKKTLLFLLIGAVITASMFITGCETESAASNNVAIAPTSASIQEGETVTFTASGGYQYSWSLSEPEWGTLTHSEGNTTTYTSTYSPSTNESAYQVLTVISTIDGASTQADGSDTNSSYGMTAEVYIEHYTVGSGDTNETAEISISPTSASISQWSSQEFTASGGSGSYTWSVASNDWGTLSSTSGSTVSYTATSDPGDDTTVLQTVTVTDSDGASTSANVTQTD